MWNDQNWYLHSSCREQLIWFLSVQDDTHQKHRCPLVFSHLPAALLDYYAASSGRGCPCRFHGHPGSPWRTFLQTPHRGCSHPTPRSPVVPAAQQGSAPWRHVPYPFHGGWPPAANGGVWFGRLPRPRAASRHNCKPSVCPSSTHWPLRALHQPLQLHKQKRFLWNLLG